MCALYHAECRGICGDGILSLNNGESCDDGNNLDGDGCDADCKVRAACGNGVLEPGEECDDGNRIDGDGCSAACRRERCGDGIVQAGLGEECDDGPAGSASCTAACRRPCLETCDPDLNGEGREPVGLVGLSFRRLARYDAEAWCECLLFHGGLRGGILE